MSENKGIWIAFVIIVVIAALGLWWVSWNQPISSATPGATTTAATTTPATTGGDEQTIDMSSSNVIAVAEGLSGTSEFNSLLSSTGVAATLTGKGPYTIFVPTDGSMSQLAAGTISNMTAAQLKRFVQYHIVKGRAIDAEATIAGSIQALSGDALNFSYGPTKIPMVDSAILITEYKASNGVVYLIDNALLPPQKLNQ